ncbi:MAG: c-type cytochrome [Gammaproteobacteria bacterium]|nr:c-type cytochrome [Gammaproteobacteria bacterium]
MPLAIVLIVLVVGSLLFHFLSPWTFTPIASNWGMIDTTVDITFVVTGFVFVAVNLFMAYAIIRYRHRPGAKAKYEPENKKLEVLLTVVTTIGVAAMLTPGLFVWAKFVDVPEGAVEVEAVGQQWHWSFRLPGKDGEFGIVDAKLIGVENPFGIDPDDPHGNDDVLVDDAVVHIPVGGPVQFWLRSKDVLHNFTVAQFRVKMDLVPGLESYMWLEPTVVGEYEVLCEELCGIAHHAMRGRVVVDTPEDYQAWVDSQPTFAETQAKAGGNAALGAAAYAVCAACHGSQAEGLVALNAPKLSGQDPKYLKKQLQNYKLGRRGAHEDDTYGKQMAPMAATLVNDAMIDNVIAYIGSLPDTPAPATVDGDIAHGAELYVICANCHGADGQGIPMNAPRQTGINDWYLLRQLENFKQGLRGTHPHDLGGKQMGFMARTLQDEQAMRDVVAYINTL